LTNSVLHIFSYDNFEVTKKVGKRWEHDQIKYQIHLCAFTDPENAEPGMMHGKNFL